MAQTHKGFCYCGAVEIEASGDPIDMGYCHCNECRRYSTGPVSIFTLWKPETVKITKGAESLGRFHASKLSDRRYCTRCGGHVMIDHPTLGLADIRVALTNFTFKPTVHFNYEDKVLPVRDGLPKLRDFPAAIGGTGQTIPE
jgi:hypothetical protein